MPVAADSPLKAPFPYAGGKARVADVVWQRFGDVANFVEPFAGSLAITLRRPAEHFADGYRVETINDANHYVVNFWRCIAQGKAKEVAAWADWPVMEADLHARHRWLVRSDEAHGWRVQFAQDPHFCDPKIAGWWVWGQCCWIGGAWCHDNTAVSTPDTAGRPSLHTNAEGGLNRHDHGQRPAFQQGGLGWGVNAAGEVAGADHAKRPSIGHGAGRGLLHGSDPLSRNENVRPSLHNGNGIHGGRPQLTDAFDIGRGVNAGGDLNHKRPILPGPGDAPGACGVIAAAYLGTCDARRAWLEEWMQRLADRLRLVRTCYGHWSRVCDSDSTLNRLGLTGVFLDPPYPLTVEKTGKKSRDGSLYATDKNSDLNQLRDEVREWCLRWGGEPLIRVAVCCYEGDGYEVLSEYGWDCFEWETGGGYSNQRRGGKGKGDNARRERIYFSPWCLRKEATLLDGWE